MSLSRPFSLNTCRWLAAFALFSAWGLNAGAQSPRIVIWGTSTIVTNVPAGLTNIKAVAAGSFHCLALRSNGFVVAWGDNSSLQTIVPATLSNVIAIAAGDAHSLALRSNGTVVGWGRNTSGQANPPAGLTNVVQIAAGANHSLARRSNGTVIAWGSNADGQTNVPAGLTAVASISAGSDHCLVLKSNGTMVAWGDNDSGQTNILSGLSNVLAVAAGYHHNLAIRSNRTVAEWELNVFGEGDVPPGLSNVIAVAAGHFYSMALRSNGTVAAWGGTDPAMANVPPGLSNVVAIATPVSLSGDFSMALRPTPVCPPGFPDNFECRAVISGSNISFAVNNTGATSEANEPEHFDFDAGKSLWYTWTAPFSGGAVIVANASFATPCLAVYTGNDVSTLTNVVRNNTAFFQSRVVFNAVAGTNYQIAVDGTTFSGNPGTGAMNITLTLTPPPANDLFANRAPLPSLFFETNGSFVGATQEAGEPAHTNNNGDSSFKHTLWWTWAAPTNLGVSAIPVRLLADAVSFPPNLAVYTGSAVGSLATVPLSAQTNGMTRVAGFTAVPGTAYQIALGGLQYEPVGVNISPRFGNYRFRLNLRALVLSFANISPTNNPNETVSFGANLQVTNYGSSASGPLRTRITAFSGVSVKGQDTGYVTNSQILLLTTNLSALPPGQGITRRIAAIVPAPTNSPGLNPTNGVGYGAYAQLQEQVDTNWFTIDEALVLFGNWPDLGGFQGPGGGVIRLDPGLTGAGFNPLASVAVLGPSNVLEGSSALYSGRATYASGFQYNFTNTIWTATLFSITNGLFTTGSVISNTPATLVAKFSSGGFTYDAATNVLVLNLPPPTLAQVKVLTNQQFSFQVQGVTNRKHVVEATVTLGNPIVWVPVGTNTLTNGLWNFLVPTTNFPRRFFRARESQ